MRIVSEASESILTILKPFLRKEKGTRWTRYCVQRTTAEGVLVFNLLTRELILLNQQELNTIFELDYLKEHWFIVPENTKENEIAAFLKLTLSMRQPKTREITTYTIFTTTDCNARCFYCFELGRSRIPMSQETAENVVQYIKSHCGGKKVNIGWFGGEPLFNIDAIDTISAGLRREGIEFTSRMVSNGYLFDDEMVRRAVALWNLKWVQITLDGTEKIYNRIKAYIYQNTNPFETVMRNIARLLDAGIRVKIRLNMDLYNAENLHELADELSRRFANYTGISVYAHHLFRDDIPDADLHSEDEWNKREAAMESLNKTLENNGLLQKKGIDRNIKLNHCMADSGKAITILPDGNLGLCEHHTENEFIGNLDSEILDVAMIKSWKERVPEIPECAECFYYLDCIKLRKCSNRSVCYSQFRYDRLKSTQRAMLCEYERWKLDANNKDDEDTDIC